MNGGYKVIDFKGVSLSSTPVVISGIRDQITIAIFKKAALLANVILAGQKMDECYSSAVDDNDDVVFTAYGGTIRVTEDDKVSFESGTVEPYVLPTATASRLGGVKVGDNLGVDNDGTLKGVHNYSTTETVVGTWVDGKPVYEKTVDVGAMPNNTIKSVPHNISDFKNCVMMYGAAIRSTDNDILVLPYCDSVATNSVGIGMTDVNLIISTGRDYTAYSGYLTVRYTKTTD